MSTKTTTTKTTTTKTCNCLSSSGRALIHVVILAVLGCLTLKDLAANIDDYLHNNFITTTRFVPVDDKFPFLPNITVELQWRSDDLQPFLDVDSPSGGVGGDGGGAGAIWNDTRFGRDYRLMQIAECLQSLDREVINGRLSSQPCEETLPSDDQLRNRSLLDETDRLYRRLRGLLVDDNRVPVHDADFLTRDSLSLTLPVASLFDPTARQSQLIFCIGQPDSLNLSGLLLHEDLFQISRPFFSQHRFPVQTLITVGTKGVMNVTGFKTCVDGVLSDKVAAYQCKLRSIARACDCTPFTFRHAFGAAAAQRRICTPKIYAKCWTNRTRRAIWDECRRETACVNVVPSYIYNFNIQPDLCPPSQLVLSVDCVTKAYLMMQMQPLTSWSQLLAQIGGNVGLYLGMSLLGVCKVVIVCLQTVRHNRRARDQGLPAHPRHDWRYFVGRQILRMRDFYDHNDVEQQRRAHVGPSSDVVRF